MRTAICIPTYNERENIPSLIDEIIATTDADVFVIDDDSPDGTGRVLDLVAKQQPRVIPVHRTVKEGIGGAYREGFRRALAAGYERIFQMDADFSHQPRYLPDLFAALDHADVVIGSRYVPEGGVETWGVFRRVLSKASNEYARRVLDIPYQDCTAGFAGYRRHVLEAIDPDSIHSDGYAFQVELKYRAHRLGFQIAEVPIVFFDRVAGRSKLSRRQIGDAVWQIVKLRMSADAPAPAPAPSRAK